MDCQYSEEQILGHLMSMTPGTTNAWRWVSWWIVYDSPDGGVPPTAPEDVNLMSLTQLATAIHRCYCFHDCPPEREDKWPGI